MIGYLKVDKLAYLNWYDNHAFDSLCNLWKDEISQSSSSDKDLIDAYNDFSCNIVYGSTTSAEVVNGLNHNFERCKKLKSKYIDKMSHTLDYMSMYDLSFTVVSEYEKFFHAKFGDVHFIFLKCADSISVQYLKSYADENIMSDNYINNSIEGIKSNLVPAGYTLSDANNEMSIIANTEAEYKDRAESIESGCAEELVDLKKTIDELNAQLQEQQEELMAQLKVAQDELELKKSELTRKIEVLETKIYAIRCFTGEVIRFSMLRYGHRMPQEIPLIINQKMRYLDEEMGRLCALYDFDFSDINYFEEFIVAHDEALDVFCPGDKSISLVKISKDGKYYGSRGVASVSRDQFKYESVLTSFQSYHGSCIGILIRDGDYLYCGWTDDEYISIPDNLFYTEKVRIDSEEDADNVVTSTKSEILSRYFIFNILKGCLSPMSTSFKIIDLPMNVDIMKQPNDYVILSSADGWIDSNKYEGFADVLKMCNESTKVGDHILSAMSIYSYNSEPFSNERGRGDRNITHSVHLSDNSIEVINMIDHCDSTACYSSDDIVIKGHRVWSRDKRRHEIVNEEVKFSKNITFDNNTTKSEVISRFKGECKSYGIPFNEDNIEWNMVNKYYVSVLKDDSRYTWYDGEYKERERDSRVNFLVYPDEFINIECMNSNWIEYYIESKKTQDVCIGGNRINYAYLIMYLQTALKHIRQREAHEMSLMMEAGFRDFDSIDWLDALSRYKLRTGRHELKPRWAKQLAQQLNSQLMPDK